MIYSKSETNSQQAKYRKLTKFQKTICYNFLLYKHCCLTKDIKNMTPEKARVFVAEDDIAWHAYIYDVLAEEGHTVVLTATTIEEALAAIEQFEKLGIQVATIDSNLNSNVTPGEDGRILLAAIKEKAPNVKTVGMSSFYVDGVDIDVGKFDCDQLGKVVKKL